MTEPTKSPFPAAEELTDRQWLEHRKTSIGASQVASVLGMNPWKSPFALWAEMTGKVEPDPNAAPVIVVEDTVAGPHPGLILNEQVSLEQGHVQEQWLSTKYFRNTHRLITNPGDFTIFRHPELKVLSCTPDRMILRPDGAENGDLISWVFARDEIVAPLELKTTGEFNMAKWRDGHPPIENQVQLQTQIAILGSDWGSLCGLVGNRELFAFDVMRNSRFIDMMLERVSEFWDMVQQDIPPTADGMKSTREALAKMHPKDNGLTVTLLDPVCLAAHRLEVAKQEKKLAEEKEKEASNILRQAIGDATFGESDDGVQLYSLKHQTRKGAYRVEMTPENKEALDAACVVYKITEPTETRVLRMLKT